MRIGYQGIPGSYSYMATQQFITHDADPDTIYDCCSYTNFPHLISDLASGQIDRIVVPVENSTTGIIARVTDHLRYQPIIATWEFYQPINHVLWGVPGTTVDQIQTVLSHPEALQQCQDFFNAHPHIQPQAFQDTAAAAKRVGDLQDPTVAAISSPLAGELYGLTLIDAGIATESTNTTRFYGMERQRPDHAYQGNKLSLYLEAKHEAGSLAKILSVFSLLNANLLNLNSRPIRNKPFSYGFFIEIALDMNASTRADVIHMLEYVCDTIQVLGIFDAHDHPRFA